MRMMHIREYTETNRYEENLNKDIDYKDNNIFLNRIYKSKLFLNQLKGAILIIIILINIPENFKE